MENYKNLQKIIKIIKEMYNGFSCEVRHQEKLKAPFSIVSREKQGCISPHLSS